MVGAGQKYALAVSLGGGVRRREGADAVLHDERELGLSDESGHCHELGDTVERQFRDL